MNPSENSNVFGAFCNSAFEQVYRDNMEEARVRHGCYNCMDVGHEPVCGHRAWGGEERPRPDGPNIILEDDMWPWLCTRAPDHEGKHIACRQSSHSLWEWGPDECERSSKTLAITVTKMLECNDAPISGKFVRRPRMDLISKPGDLTFLTVLGAVPNLNKTQKLRVLTPWHECHVMVFDCPNDIFETLPNTRFCEADIRTKRKMENIVEGITFLKGHTSGDVPQDFYTSATEVAETFSELHPIENDVLREFFEQVLRVMALYEEKHGLVV